MVGFRVPIHEAQAGVSGGFSLIEFLMRKLMLETRAPSFANSASNFQCALFIFSPFCMSQSTETNTALCSLFK